MLFWTQSGFFLNPERKKLEISQQTCWMYFDFAWLLAHSHVNPGVWRCEGMSLHAGTATAVGPRRGCGVQQVPIPGAGRHGVPGQDTVTCATALLAPCSCEESRSSCTGSASQAAEAPCSCPGSSWARSGAELRLAGGKLPAYARYPRLRSWQCSLWSHQPLRLG